MLLDAEAERVLRARAKHELRGRMRSLRATIPRGALDLRSERIVERVLGSARWAAASAVALFSPLLDRGEVDVRPLDAAARARGLTVLWPCLDGEQPALRACALDALEDRGHRFAEPPDDAPLGPTAPGLLVVVPALAFDGEGHRIGYGAGFYDRLLEGLGARATAIGVAYDFQLVAEVPVLPGDVAVAEVVTDARSIEPPAR